MDHFFKASIVLIYINIQWCTAESLHCLSCTDTVSPIHCHLIRKCPTGDVCYIEQFRTINGEQLYNMGCYTERICHDRQISAKRRQLSHLTGSENPQCVHCCKSDACNIQGCHSSGFPIQRGPLCFNCKQSRNPELCRYAKVCEFDQVCHLHEEEEFGDKFYVSSCLLQNECEVGVTVTDAFGKRTINQKSSMCCNSDLCNKGLACPAGKYGRTCMSNCGHCINRTCDSMSGACPTGCTAGSTGSNCTQQAFMDCLDIFKAGYNRTAIYKIYPWNNSTYKEVLCDMDTMGGGWTVFQKRINGYFSFSRNWTEYQHGFGNAYTEYWLGNDALHALTLNSSSLYVKLQNTNGSHFFQYYSDFRISGADDEYRLHLGSYSSGTAGFEFKRSHNNQTFKTPDHSSQRSLDCFRDYTEGGWWLGTCHNVYLNGVYGSRKWKNPWYGAISYGTEFRSSQMMTRRHH